MKDHKNHRPPDKTALPLPNPLFGGARLIALAAGLPLRGKVIGWLFMFIIAYRAGLPVIYSAALAAVPWLLLSPAKRK